MAPVLNRIVAARRRCFGFTLVELLVVIGIIALLISILLPTLSKARESAKISQCLSNQRQIAIAVIAYTNDNKGYFPSSALNPHRDDDWIFWQRAFRNRIGEGGIGPYLRLSPTNYKMMVCPSDDPDLRTRIPNDPYIFSYELNWMTTSSSNAPKIYPKMNFVVTPSDKVLIIEEDERTVDDGNCSIWLPLGAWQYVNLLAIHHDRNKRKVPDNPTDSNPVPNGDGKGCVAYCDGHAEYTTRREVHSKLHSLPNPADYPNDPNYYP
jgi:prepilin-type N-terminal cleavage/methylation domain-containing protein